MSNAEISCDKKCLQTAAVKTILTIVKLKNVGLFNFHIMKGLECMERTKIAIADDNQSILEALRSVIDEEDDMRIVGTADNGADTVKMIHESQPDVVLLDHRLVLFLPLVLLIHRLSVQDSYFSSLFSES